MLHGEVPILGVGVLQHVTKGRQLALVEDEAIVALDQVWDVLEADRTVSGVSSSFGASFIVFFLDGQCACLRIKASPSASRPRVDPAGAQRSQATDPMR